MTLGLRREIGNLTQGDHLCSICENAEEQADIAVSFIKEGLKNGECCIVAGAESTRKAAIGRLIANGADITKELQRGALKFVAEPAACHRFHEFSELLMQAETDALQNGFSGLRYLGAMTVAE